LVALIRSRIVERTVMLLSFDPEMLWAVRKVTPTAWIGKISEADPNPVFAGDGVGTTPQAMQANPVYVDVAHEHGLWVCPLDPDPDERLPWYLALGVDAVLTHDPAKTRRTLHLLTGG
jgi:glycerophosphoryl diester phosphodiesterase